MLDNNELMGKTKVSRAVAILAVPSVISSLVTIVYNLADTFFVGQTGDALQVAAVSLTNPLFILMMAFANMLGMGGAALSSVALGRKKPDEARHATAFVFYGAIFIGSFFLIALNVFMSDILKVFGADETTYELARSYASHISYGAPFIIWSASCGFLLRVEGSSAQAMAGNMIGTFTNIILDPFLISGLSLGAGGAAMATTIGNMLACIYYFHYFVKRSRNLSIAPASFSLKDGLPLRLCCTGLPSALLSVLMSVSTIIMNQILAAYGSDPVAAIGIVFKANMFIVFLQSGLANGIQPLLGYNYGCGNYDRFRTVERFAKKCCVIIGIVSLILFVGMRATIIRLFIDDDEVVRYGAKMLLAYSLSGPGIGVLFVNMNCLQSTGHPFPAGVLSVLRQGILLIPLLYLLSALTGLSGVIFTQSVTDWITILLSAAVWKRIGLKPV